MERAKGADITVILVLHNDIQPKYYEKISRLITFILDSMPSLVTFKAICGDEWNPDSFDVSTMYMPRSDLSDAFQALLNPCANGSKPLPLRLRKLEIHGRMTSTINGKTSISHLDLLSGR